MIIAGFQKNSYVDYPGQLASVIFCAGCNMDCWYCHNHGIAQDKNLSLDSIIQFLESRVGMIDGVVFSGGEMTLQPDLENVIKRIKSLGYLIKLDTNGLKPDIVKLLVEKNLIDYIAMDIKAPFEKYDKVTQTHCDVSKIKESIQYIMQSGVDYEFRTTLSPDLLVEDIRAIARSIAGAKRYAIQQYRQKCFDKILNEKPHEPRYVTLVAENAKPFVKEVIIRGI